MDFSQLPLDVVEGAINLEHRSRWLSVVEMWENGPRDSGGDRLGAGKLTVIGCWPLVDVDVEVLVKKTHVEQAPAELPHGASWPVAAKTPRRRSAEAAAAARSSANPLEATVVVVAREGVRP